MDKETLVKSSLSPGFPVFIIGPMLREKRHEKCSVSIAAEYLVIFSPRKSQSAFLFPIRCSNTTRGTVCFLAGPYALPMSVLSGHRYANHTEVINHGVTGIMQIGKSELSRQENKESGHQQTPEVKSLSRL